MTKLLVAIVLNVLLAAATFVSSVFTGPPAGAYPSGDVSFTGHGFGHGRGLSQYGSLGYALDRNWNWSQILDHYYGGTSTGAPVANVEIGVRLIGNDNAHTIVRSGVPFTVGPVSVPGGEAARVRRTGANSFAIDRAPGCGGPWTDNVATSGGPVYATSSNGSPGDVEAPMMSVCGANVRAYRGRISVHDDAGVQRTVNNVYVEDYLRGVVPRESPASWGDLGSGKGMHQLRAQSVAARSYVLAAPNYSYATTCDTTACQVYGGAFLNGVYIEDTRTNAAIAETSGVVRRVGNGSVARTEFSSSSGGWTAGGTFPAVLDEGDGIAANPNRTWTASVPVGTVESKYPSIGGLTSIQVTARNGLGDFGGRASTVTLTGTAGSVNVSGADVRAKLGLKSDWFQVGGSPSGGVGGYWMLGDDGGVFSFGNARFHGSMGGQRLNRPVITLTPLTSGNGYWLIASDGGVFSFGDTRFHGSTGNIRLNQSIVGAAATPSGNGYWMVASDGGVFAFGDAGFHGSTGGQRLNRPVVGIAPTPSGQGYWLVASDGGVFAFGDAGFHGSMGGQPLQQPVVSLQAPASGHGYWMLAADGGIFAFGTAPYRGGLPGANIATAATSLTSTRTGQGYVITSGGGVAYSFGDAPQFGGMAAVPNFRGRVTGVATTPG